MTPSDLPDFFLVEGLWVDRKILEYLVPKPDGFFSRAGSRSREPKSDFLKNYLLKLKYLNAPMTAQLHFDGQFRALPIGGAAKWYFFL